MQHCKTILETKKSSQIHKTHWDVDAGISSFFAFCLLKTKEISFFSVFCCISRDFSQELDWSALVIVMQVSHLRNEMFIFVVIGKIYFLFGLKTTTFVGHKGFGCWKDIMRTSPKKVWKAIVDFALVASSFLVNLSFKCSEEAGKNKQSKIFCHQSPFRISIYLLNKPT